MNEYNPADQQAGIAYAERVASERFASTGEQVSQTTRMLMGCAFEAGAAHGRGQVPAGWKLVPVEPTREMLVAINWPNDPAGYRAMLAATPATPAAEQPDAWAPSGADYDRNIHRNPDAAAWADLFVATFPGLADKHDLMHGWFANAMMAMHDFLKAQQPDTVAVPRAVLADIAQDTEDSGAQLLANRLRALLRGGVA